MVDNNLYLYCKARDYKLEFYFKKQAQVTFEDI